MSVELYSTCCCKLHTLLFLKYLWPLGTVECVHVLFEVRLFVIIVY